MSDALMMAMDHHGHSKKWLAVDLDGTLAHYDGWKGADHIGPPVKGIMDKLIQRHKEGWGIAIFTARVSVTHEAEQAEKTIWAWLEKYELSQFISGVTCVKHKHFVEFWDDRAFNSPKNSGLIVGIDCGTGYAGTLANCNMSDFEKSAIANSHAKHGYLVQQPINELKASDKQVGGSHYNKYKIQPFVFAFENNMPFLEANVLKYIMRHKDKNGIDDLKKAKHYIQLAAEMYYKEQI